MSIQNAPLPLEEVCARNEDGSSVPFKDISGERLPGISKWAGNVGGEYATPVKFLIRTASSSSRSMLTTVQSFRQVRHFSILNVDEYALVNGRFGLRATDGYRLQYGHGTC